MFTPFQQLDTLHTILITIITLLVYRIVFPPPAPPAPSPRIAPSKMVDFLLTIGRLKQEKRTGWVNNNIPIPESIADHQYRMAIMGYFIRDEARDPKMTAMVALVHDVAEAIVGDITPPESSGISVSEKHALEAAAMKTISDQLQTDCGESVLGFEIEDLYAQYNSQTTTEGRFCKQLDKLEMLFQAFEYESLHKDKDLSGFYHSAAKGIHDPYLVELQKEVLQRRRGMKGELTPTVKKTVHFDLNTNTERILEPIERSSN